MISSPNEGARLTKRIDRHKLRRNFRNIKSDSHKEIKTPMGLIIRETLS